MCCLVWFNRLTVWHFPVIYCGFACITFMGFDTELSTWDLVQHSNCTPNSSTSIEI